MKVGIRPFYQYLETTVNPSIIIGGTHSQRSYRHQHTTSCWILMLFVGQNEGYMELKNFYRKSKTVLDLEVCNIPKILYK